MGMPENEVLGGSTEFVVMRSKALTPHYVYCIARSYYFRQTAILSMNGADGRQRVDEDKLKSIVKDYKRSKIVHVEKKPGRNDPCPCGSGKKYKNCCGRN